jgi:hypothetical protein
VRVLRRGEGWEGFVVVGRVDGWGRGFGTDWVEGRAEWMDVLHLVM